MPPSLYPSSRKLQNYRTRKTALAVSLATLATAGYALNGHAVVAQGIEEIVVSGSAQQSRQEISTRRESNQIVDSLSHDEIGALPDVTLADSLRRITGVTTLYDDDIGQFASVRGVDPDLVPVTFNGLTLATTGNMGEGSRRVNLQVIPGRAVQQVEVFKSYTADQESGAVGGHINLVPMSAHDLDEQLIIADVFTSYTTYMDVPDDNSAGSENKDSPYGMGFNGLFADTFGANDEFGLVVSGMWTERPRTQTNNNRVDRLYFNDEGEKTSPANADWNGYSSPERFLTLNYTNNFINYGASTRLDYRPSDDFSTNLFAYAYFADQEETRNRTRYFGLDQVEDQTEHSGSLNAQHADTQWRFNPFERTNHGIQWETIASVGDKGELRFNTGYSYADFFSERPLVAFRYANADKRIQYDGYDFSVSPEDQRDYLDPSNYGFYNAYRDWRSAEQDVIDTRLDYSYNTGEGQRGWGYNVGLRYTDLDLSRNIDKIQYNRNMDLTMEGLSFVPDFIPGGFATPLLWLNKDKFWNEFLPANITVDEETSAHDSFIDDYRYLEETFNAYASVSYATDKFYLQGGLRTDSTSFDATMAQIVDGNLQSDYMTQSGDYDEVLPYLNGIYNLTDNSRIKFGVSQTLGRPNPNQIARVEDRNDIDLIVNRGNPNLKPRQSTNFDIGYEYFFRDTDAMFTASIFGKNIDDDIVTVGDTQLIDGETWTVNEPLNGESTKYRGAEFGLINNSFGHLSPILENIGASANLSYVDGSTHYIYNGESIKRNSLLNQIKVAGNAAIFYDFGGGSEVRLTYNYQSDYVSDYGADPWLDITNDDFDTVDMTVKWSLTPNWRLRLEGRNIFSNNRLRLVGPDQDITRANIEVGSYWALHLVFRH